MGQQEAHPPGVPASAGGRLETEALASPGGVGSATAVDRWLAKRLAHAAGSPAVKFALWDGSIAYAPPARAVGTITFGDRGALWSAVLSPEIGFGDAYCAGRVHVSDDLVGVLREVFEATDRSGSGALKRSLSGRLPKPRANTRRRSRQHIQHHYDLGNDFYRLWLDAGMVYTCAYYRHPRASLEEAQLAKMEHVCRKLELRPGQTVVEAGCGWGALALHMARNHGVRVRAFNISREQIAYARDRASREGLDDRVEFVEDDYRNIDGEYDAFASVGMLEHVGLDNYRTLSDVIDRTLKPHGRGLIHSVGRSRPSPPNAWLERRIFPGSHPPSLREMMDVFEPHRFSVLDVENLRLHYAATLIEWLRRFDACVEDVRARYDDAFVRAWRLYLAGCGAAFLSSSIQLYQVVFARPCDNAIPMTREHVYGAAGSGGDYARWEFAG